MSREKVVKAFGSRIRELRQQREISQETLGEMCALHRNYIGALERGQYNVSLVNIAKIAAALRVSMPDLFQGVPVYEGLRTEVRKLWRERDRLLPP